LMRELTIVCWANTARGDYEIVLLRHATRGLDTDL